MCLMSLAIRLYEIVLYVFDVLVFFCVCACVRVCCCVRFVVVFVCVLLTKNTHIQTMRGKQHANKQNNERRERGGRLFIIIRN